MRIISGIYKGRKLKSAPDSVSPTKDSVRERIFDIIRPKVKKSRVLDLFAGSGALGLEALSHMARLVFFVDKDVTAINKNIEVLSLKSDERVRVLKKDALSFIEEAKKDGLVFDLIFLDPPYGEGMVRKCLKKISRYDILRPNGIIIAEHESKCKLSQLVGIFRLMRMFKSGRTSVSFYKKRG